VYYLEEEGLDLSPDKYRLSWVTKDELQVLVSIVRLDVGTDKQQKAYEKFQLAVYQALQNSPDDLGKVIDDAYNQRSRNQPAVLPL